VAVAAAFEGAFRQECGQAAARTSGALPSGA